MEELSNSHKGTKMTETNRASLTVGHFFEIGFGNGTQLIKVHALTKNLKRAVITRCEAWKATGAGKYPQRPVWKIKATTIAIDDDRLGRDHGTECPINQTPFSDDVVLAHLEACKQYKVAEGKVLKGLTDQANAAAEGVTLSPCENQAYCGKAPRNCKVEGPHFSNSSRGPKVVSHDWSCVARKELEEISYQIANWDARNALTGELEQVEDIQARLLAESAA